MARPHFRKGSLWGQSLGNKWPGCVCNSLSQVQEVSCSFSVYIGIKRHACHRSQCIWKSGSDIDCMCAYLGFGFI